MLGLSCVVVQSDPRGNDGASKKLMEVETLEREEYEALLKAEGVEVKDAYRDMREAEEATGDPSKTLEAAPVKKDEADEV